MSDPILKYAKLVDLLLAKTKSSKIPWEYDSARKELAVWNGEVLFNMNRSQDENYEDIYKCALYNKSGTPLEAFDDSTLSGVEIEFGEDNYFERMRDLFTLGMRQATGADKALDDFIDAVEKDQLDMPF